MTMTMPGKLLPWRPARPRPEVSSDQRSDARLVEDCAGGDRAAMADLFDRHGDAVHRLLCCLHGADADVDDLVHATFMEAFRAARRYRGRAQVRTWLFGIAVNVARHHRRTEGRRRAMLRTWAQRRPPESSRPDQLAERQQLLARLQEALVRLPAPLRAAYLLCEVEECSGPEAAAALGVRPGTLGRHLHEARRALRAALEGGGA
jgi:RNA polymerase sigma-70 factor (ECF subfamily)